MKTVEETRRELFETWYFEAYQKPVGVEDSPDNLKLRRGDAGDYSEYPSMRNKWAGFNAGLDSVTIELPSCFETYGHSAETARVVTDDCADAIESTGLGLKVLP